MASSLPQTPLEKAEEKIVEYLKEAGLNAKYLIAVFPDNPDKFDLGDVERALLCVLTCIVN